MNADHHDDELRVHADRGALCRAVAQDLVEVLRTAVADRGMASAVLTGGGTGTGILEALDDPALATAVDWTKVHLWWGDERFLPSGDPERNEVQATGALLAGLVADQGLPTENIHRMPAQHPGGDDPSQQLPTAGVQYAEELARHAEEDPGEDRRLPCLDVVLLGMGPDAHVASLFPGLPGPTVVGETVVGVEGSPKPPAERLSLTVEALNTASRVWFVVTGADKAATVETVRTARNEHRADAGRWPASAVTGQIETRWELDRAAAGLEPVDGG